ncbi:Pyruvate/Phosphoenolpyruvate kinase-like domain-containing protein [Mycena pura]|uniref:Pyruvate/Phosphoenolpyruvate kinase-like domain-containing protein n=1 Tax=Mycena pura TaxID=153505 RepID=A0AAD7E5F4_9AGAR|nr:Pyruvate/Phosphoenolpyruvate kinase-like domain-containing protein [Mycena pura]
MQGTHRAPTLQQASNLQALFKSGKILAGAALSYPSRQVAKTVAATGADWCWLDAEHVAWTPKLLVECIQIIVHESGGKMIPVVRVPNKIAFDYMAWCLDAGAGGIIVPHMETAAEMQQVVAACRFPPDGQRSYPPFSFIPGVTDITPEGETIFSLANKHTAIIPQIESRRGIENLEEILQVGNIAAFMIGATDLRLDLGLPMNPATEPDYMATVHKARAVSAATRIPLLGVAVGPEMVRQQLDAGFRVLLCAIDLQVLAFGMIQALSEAREAAEEHMQRIA